MMTLLENSEPYRMTVAEYMATEAPEKSELVEGIVYEVSPRNSPHQHAVSMLSRSLTLAFRETFLVQSEGAVAVHGWTGKNAPEVDIAVLADGAYAMPPTAADTRACIEISDTTYRDDRRVKIPMYVAAGIPSWIVNVRERRVEEYTTIADLALPHGRIVHEGDTFTVLGVPVAVSSILLPIASRST